MNTPAPTSSRRRAWLWVLLAVLLTPFVVLGAAAYSYLTLDREAAVLRRQVFAATDSGWKTKVQVSVGRFTLGGIRTCLAFVHHQGIDEARQGLAAVRCASVGVYQRAAGSQAWSHDQLISRTDRAMETRGWTRIVGVAEDRQTVLIYVPEGDEDIGKVCLAVVGPRELVVVSTTLRVEALGELIRQHAGGKLDLGRKLRLGKI